MSNSSRKVIGIMSGTSLDGVDLAYIEFHIVRKKVKYRILKAKTFPYESGLLKKIKNSRELSGFDLISLDRELGRFYGELVLKFCGNNLPDLISSHGHTVFHQPEKGITLQIGSGAEIAAITGIKTVCDFRTTDVALKGQGAPLVPFGDELLFYEFDYCLNLGGFSNISYHSKNGRIAYDISPCNLILNYLAQRKNLSFDNNGNLASKGKLIKPLFSKLNNLSFYKRNEIQSLGAEWFEKEFLRLFKKSNASVEDLLFTATEHIAYQIASSIEEHKTVLVTGGGAHNLFLINAIRRLSGSEIIIPSKELIDFKEALLFGLLGYLREHEWINTLSTVTGAKRNSSGGAIYHP